MLRTPDVRYGGPDLRTKAGYHPVLNHTRKASSGARVKFILHLAPPCSHFSRVRNRHPSTRVRSKLRILGLPGLRPDVAQKVRDANKMADVAVDLARAAAAMGVIHHNRPPASSYT